MLSAIKERRPWVAALISLLAGPFFGMLYLNRGRNAVLYLVALVGAPSLVTAIFHDRAFGLLGEALIALSISVAGAIHAFFIARNRPVSEPIRWYAKPLTLGLTLAFVAASVFVSHSANRAFNNVSGSSEPTLAMGDRIFVDAAAFDFTQPRRGDLIVFHPSMDPKAAFVKRIVGLPGDHIQMVAGYLHINGQVMNRRRIADYREEPNGCATDDCGVPQFLETLPGHVPYRILQRSGSFDQDNTKIFVVPAGHYFVLGDNRENSIDSRMDEIGFVPADAIIGKVTTKYFDATAGKLVWQRVD